MSTLATSIPATPSPVDVFVAPALDNRNRLTSAFRLLLALPHLILVGGPVAGALSWTWSGTGGSHVELGTVGALGAVAALAALIAWFAIVFTGRHPQGLWTLAAFYLRWRVRAVAYTALLRDEYPPFGDGTYPAALEIDPPKEARDRLSVALRPIIVLPHVIIVWALSMAWAVTSIIAWFAILFTGRYPRELFDFATGVLRWSTRVEAYLLLLHDDYPPFSLS
jgi:hypothetical protein